LAFEINLGWCRDVESWCAESVVPKALTAGR
jgi:hypothetical protein